MTLEPLLVVAAAVPLSAVGLVHVIRADGRGRRPPRSHLEHGARDLRLP